MDARGEKLLPVPFAAVFHPLKSYPDNENPSPVGTVIDEPSAAALEDVYPVPPFASNESSE
jgi:hypothetical protein